MVRWQQMSWPKSKRENRKRKKRKRRSRWQKRNAIFLITRGSKVTLKRPKKSIWTNCLISSWTKPTSLGTFYHCIALIHALLILFLTKKTIYNKVWIYWPIDTELRKRTFLLNLCLSYDGGVGLIVRSLLKAWKSKYT